MMFLEKHGVYKTRSHGCNVPPFRSFFYRIWKVSNLMMLSANNTRVGLASYFYSNDVRQCWRVGKRLESGQNSSCFGSFWIWGSGSVLTSLVDLWHFGTNLDPDPCFWPMDPAPDPAIFVLDLQDANQKFFLVFLLIVFLRYIYIIFSKIQSHSKVAKQ